MWNKHYIITLLFSSFVIKERLHTVRLSFRLSVCLFLFEYTNIFLCELFNAEYISRDLFLYDV